MLWQTLWTAFELNHRDNRWSDTCAIDLEGLDDNEAGFYDISSQSIT